MANDFTMPVPAEATESTFVKASELVDAVPPWRFSVTRIGEGETKYGSRWYVQVRAANDAGEATIGFSQDDNTRNDVIMAMSEHLRHNKGSSIFVSLHRTGAGGSTITLGPAKADSVAYEVAGDDSDLPF